MIGMRTWAGRITTVGVLLFVAGLVGHSSISNTLVSVATVLAAPAAVDVNDLAFSEDVDDEARPRDPKIEFDSSTEDIWVSFQFREFHGGQVSFLARANGEDWASGDLDCCEGSEGRYAFPLRRRSGKDLGGAAYEVRIYVNDEEKAHGGFGVRGTKGFDSDEHDDGNGNDNN